MTRTTSHGTWTIGLAGVVGGVTSTITPSLLASGWRERAKDPSPGSARESVTVCAVLMVVHCEAEDVTELTSESLDEMLPLLEDRNGKKFLT